MPLDKFEILAAGALCYGIIAHVVGIRTRDRLKKELATASENARTKDEQMANEKKLFLDQIQETKRYFETEAAAAIAASQMKIDALQARLAEVDGLLALTDKPENLVFTLQVALKKAGEAREMADALMAAANRDALVKRNEGKAQAERIEAEAREMLSRATRLSREIVSKAEEAARAISSEGYEVFRDLDSLRKALTAIRNQIEGYGEKYIVPTHSMVDELAAGYSHTSAGRALSEARERSRQLVLSGDAGTCDYVEDNRKATATRFVIDAFNGRVDAILSEVDTKNFGVLEAQVRDSFNLVNLNGVAFRNARILPEYLEARLSELKWATATIELREREREEQRQIKEQIREEERARREYEKAVRDAEADEARIKKALEKAREEISESSERERSKFESKILELEQKLKEAEEANKRAISMAQQTKRGHVYIISNIGSFGDDVFKIGMTRRMDPMDRVWELGDASVPFDFDVHAIIPAEDAPALESYLHGQFDDARVNLVNPKKEFFRTTALNLREKLKARDIQANFTELAEAREYRETHALRNRGVGKV